jgi:lactobin A/cerein 7B family class IIb bacteriocin
MVRNRVIPYESTKGKGARIMPSYSNVNAWASTPTSKELSILTDKEVSDVSGGCLPLILAWGIGVLTGIPLGAVIWDVLKSNSEPDGLGRIQDNRTDAGVPSEHYDEVAGVCR